MNEDEKWMHLALEQAKRAELEGEIPVGAVLVKDGLLLAKAHNQSILKNDASAHAEIQLIRKAGQIIKNYRLINTTIYITLEPCSMCLGAIMNARISRIVYGAHDYKTGVCGSCIDLVNNKCFNHKIEIKFGILEEKCKQLLQKFFQTKRKKLIQ
tara:strand:- start:21 stop:485 length:465 start_codon:yes stop_codon:yes gene_type:complete